MLRIVPADVSSGDEWGSDAEADARDIGRFRRISNTDLDTFRYALKLYPPRNKKTRDKIFASFGLTSSTEALGGAGTGEDFEIDEDGDGSPKYGGVSGASWNNGLGAREDSGDVEDDSYVGGVEGSGARNPEALKSGTQPLRFGKNDHALLASYGVRKPKGKHPGYVVTLYGKKVVYPFLTPYPGRNEYSFFPL